MLGNGAQLQEALDNLIDNALRYAGRDATVTVGVHALDDNDVELYVEDNGPGVPEDVMPRLGERFFRAPAPPPAAPAWAWPSPTRRWSTSAGA